MRRLLTLALVFAALLGAGTARAAGPPTLAATFRAPPLLVGGPVLAGDHVAWAAQWPGGAPDVVTETFLYSATAAGAPSRLARVGVDESDGGEYDAGALLRSLVGSPGHLAWTTLDFDTGASKYGFDLPNPIHVWTLGADGRPAEICRGDVPHVPPYITKDSVSLDGARLARSGCADTPGILISDLNSPGAPAVGIAPDGGPVRIAGDFVAWRTDQGFEVLNRATGAQTALSLEHAPLPAPVDDFDVAPDGTLAVIGGVGPDESSPFAGWASPSDPSWHAFGVAGLRNVGVHVRGGRIAVLVGVPERRRVEVRLLDLAGGQTTAAVGNDPRLGLSPFYSEAIHAGFDFDGTSVAWATRACGSLVVMVTPVGAGTATGPSPGGCAVLVSPASVTVRNRVAKVALRCPAPAVPQRSDRCAGALRASLARHGHAAPVRFSVPPDAARDVRLKLPARWSRLLARRHRLRITVQARSATRGHVSLTRAPVTLRAR